uniref:Uncharacterized protein n=1 Tax=Setaria italica TaxID=4555 RepID=K3YWG5_SETIT
MRSSHGGSRACAMTAFLILLFGCFALCVHCRSPALKDGGGTEKSYLRNDSHLTTPCPSSLSAASSSTSPVNDESKIELVMCVYKGLQCVEGEPCHCCVLEQPEPPCYFTHSECVAKCPFCYPPPCSPPGPTVEGRALQAGSNNATM